MSTLGEKLKIARRNSGYTMEEVATMFELSPSAFVHYEKDRRTPEIELINKLASLYKVSVDFLVNEQPTKIDDDFAKILFTQILNVFPKKKPSVLQAKTHKDLKILSVYPDYVVEELLEKAYNQPKRNLFPVTEVIPRSELSSKEIIDYMHFPSQYLDEDSFVLKVSNDSFNSDGFMEGDLIAITKTSTVEPGRMVLAYVNEVPVIKRFYQVGDKIRLEPSDRFLKPLEPEEVEIIGIVTLHIRPVY